MELQTSSKNNYYFQLVLRELAWGQRELAPELYFTVNRGRQIFQFTKPIAPSWNQEGKAPLSLKLNFVVINYSAHKDEEFSVKVVSPTSDQTQGEDTLDCNAFIDHFSATGQPAFAVHLSLGAHQVESDIYVGRSRVAVQKAARDTAREGLVRIEQRPKQMRSSSRGKETNRYRRTPSPTRRQIQEIIARRKSPQRKAPEEPKNTISVTACQLSQPEERQKAEKKEQSPNKDIPEEKDQNNQASLSHNQESQPTIDIKQQAPKTINQPANEATSQEHQPIPTQEKEKVATEGEELAERQVHTTEGEVAANGAEVKEIRVNETEVKANETEVRTNEGQVKVATEGAKPQGGDIASLDKEDSSLKTMFGTPKVLISFVAILVMLILISVNWSGPPLAKKGKLAQGHSLNPKTAGKEKKGEKEGKGKKK